MRLDIEAKYIARPNSSLPLTTLSQWRAHHTYFTPKGSNPYYWKVSQSPWLTDISEGWIKRGRQWGTTHSSVKGSQKERLLNMSVPSLENPWRILRMYIWPTRILTPWLLRTVSKRTAEHLPRVWEMLLLHILLLPSFTEKVKILKAIILLSKGLIKSWF